MKAGDLLQSNTYSALLRTNEWSDYAQGIRKSRNNACECCRRGGVQTHVHHIFYDSTLKPWEHNPDDVVLLCSGCHKELHEQLKNFRRHVFRFLQPGHLKVLNGALAAGLTNNNPLEFVHAVAEMAASPSSIERFAYAWNNGKRTEKRDQYNATENDYREKH
jgi:hypothetical protein